MQEHHHRSRNRLSKEEVKDDEFVAWLFRMVTYAEQNYPKIIAGLAAVAVVIVAIVFINSSAKQKSAAAIDAIGDVQVHLMQGNVGSAIARAQEVVREYDGSPAAGYAQMLLASAYFEQGRFGEARNAYQAFLNSYGSEGPQGYEAWAGIASCAVEEGNLEGAAQQYLQYVDQHPDTPFAVLSLQAAARCFELAGNEEKRADTLNRIISEYPDTPVRREAELDLKMLGHTIG